MVSIVFVGPLAVAAPPQPYNLYGIARQSDGATPISLGTRITAFIDGVDYSNGTSVYTAGGAYDVDVFGDWVTQTGQPNTPAVKEGGNVGDEIMFVAGDFTNAGQVFTTKKFWAPGDVVMENVQLAPSANQPGLLKIARVVTRPADGLSQYVYLCNPTAGVINADGYNLHKDVPGSFNGPVHTISGVGNVGPGGLAYVNLTGALTLTATGDNLKLVWRNIGGPAFGGSDVIVDRVEFNQTGGPGTLFWEPGNTLMTDAPAPALGQEIRRTLACADTNSNAADFTLAAETGRPGANTAPTVTLTTPNGGQDWTGGTMHAIQWSMSDVEDASMSVAIHLSIAPADGFPISVTTGTYPTGANSFNWNVNLVNTTTARIRVCAFDSGALSGCAVSAADFTIDSARPTLDSTNPANGATAVDVNANLVLTFNEGMARTATEGAITIAPDPGARTFSWNPASTVLTIDPVGPMAGNTLHTVTVGCGARDDSDTGNTLAACPRSFTFTTAMGAIAPTVDVTRPDGGERWSGASVQTIGWTMSDADTPGTLTVDIHYSTDGGVTFPNTIITSQVRSQGANTFSWSVPMINTATARVRVCASDGAQVTCDMSAANFAIDSIRPTVLSNDPTNGAQGVAPSRDLIIVFSERMNETATNAAFSIAPNPGGLVFNWNAQGDTLTVRHLSFTACTDHTVTISATAKDVSDPGNGMAAPATFTFRTACPPSITISSPAGGEVWSGGSTQDVSFTITDEDATVTVWINLSTNGGTTWTPLSGPATRNTGAATVQVTMPTVDAANAIIRVSAQDSASLVGIATSAPFAIDATAPTVTASVPAPAATNVPVTQDLTLTFSESMDRTSTESAMSLTPAAAPLTFTWNAQSTVLTIGHAPLQTSTTYTLVVGTAARDASSPGNAFASPHTVTFTTSSVGAVVADPGGPYTATAGTPIRFDGTGSTGSIVNYTWEVLLPTGSVFGYGDRPLFTFSASGTFTVTLTVRDGAGNTDTDSTTVAVSGGPGGADFLSTYWWLFLILIVAILLALFFVLGKRRKKEEEPMPAEVPPERVETIPPAAVRAPPKKPAAKPAPPKPAAPPAAPAAAPKAKPTTKECPACGTIVDATDTECFMCGHAF